MKTISIVSQKGGAGKSMLATNLSVAAPGRVLIADMDPQKTAESWYQKREADEPKLVTARAGEIASVVQRAESAGFDWLIIDTAGKSDPSGAAAVAVADLCLIPTRPAAFDLEAVTDTMSAVKTAGKPFAFVVTQANPIGSRGSSTVDALKALGPCSPIMCQRVIYQDAAAVGLTALEGEPDGKAAKEVSAIWVYVGKQLSKQVVL